LFFALAPSGAKGINLPLSEARVWEHNNLPIDGYTARRRPVTLVFTESYDRITDAIARERQLKGWSRRKKEALIALAYETLPELSRRGHLVPKICND
jgi:putative endonuclease